MLVVFPDRALAAKYVPAPAMTITITRMIAPIIGLDPPPDFGAEDEGGLNSSDGDLVTFGGGAPLLLGVVAIFHSRNSLMGVNG